METTYQDPTKELAPVKARTTRMALAVSNLSIKDDAGLAEATKIRAGIKDVAKQVDTKKKEITAPLNLALKNTRALFAPLEEACAEASRELDSKVIAYNREVEKTRREAEAKEAAKVAKGSIKVETAARHLESVPEPTKTVSTDQGSLTIRKIKKVKVTNPALLPREYMIPDEVLIRKDALAGKVIPGVEVYEEDSVASY